MRDPRSPPPKPAAPTRPGPERRPAEPIEGEQPAPRPAARASVDGGRKPPETAEVEVQPAEVEAEPLPPRSTAAKTLDGPILEVSERSGEEPAHPGMPLSPPGIVPESDVRVHSPAAAQPHHHQGPFEERLGELPWAYGDGKLVTLLRDPRTIFVYWDLSQQQIEQGFQGLGAAKAMLKLWNSPSGGEFVRELEVHLEARGWYVRE